MTPALALAPKFWGHNQRTTVGVVTQALSEEKSRRLHRPPPRTAHLCVRLERAPLEHARSKCGDRPSLGGRCYGCIGAPRRLALHMLRQHKRLPRTLHTMISGPPLPTLVLGRSAKRTKPSTERLEQREAHEVFDITTTKRQRAHVIGGGALVGAWARSPQSTLGA